MDSRRCVCFILNYEHIILIWNKGFLVKAKQNKQQQQQQQQYFQLEVGFHAWECKNTVFYLWLVESVDAKGWLFLLKNNNNNNHL